MHKSDNHKLDMHYDGDRRNEGNCNTVRLQPNDRGLVICDAWSVAKCIMNNLTSAKLR